MNSRSCQVFPEYSYKWLEEEFETIQTRSADPFVISEKTKEELREVFKYWDGKTSSELATAYMKSETLDAIEHNIFTPGNYFYNGIGHVTVDYAKVLKIGYKGIIAEAKEALAKINAGDADACSKIAFLEAVIESCAAVITFANRYAELARKEAESCADATRKQELLKIAEI